MHAMMLMLMPDALAQLTGLDPGAFLNRIVPASEVLDAPWMTLCRPWMRPPMTRPAWRSWMNS
jgi:hypothetical protein